MTSPLHECFSIITVYLQEVRIKSKMAPGKPLKESKIQEMKNEFLKLDIDGDGSISVQELGNILRSMKGKLKVSEEEIEKVLKEIDNDKDGYIDVKEYFANMENSTSKNLIHRALVQRSKARKAFEKFDKDGSGYVTIDELLEIFDEFEEGTVSHQQFEELLSDCIKDEEGKIDYEEFLATCLQTE